MESKRLFVFAGAVMVCLLFVGTYATASAQGRGRGAGGSMGRGSSGGGNSGMGNASGGGIDRGINTSSDRSAGHADRGRNAASDRSDGRSDEETNRARAGRNNRDDATMTSNDRELNRYRGIAQKLNTTPEALQSQYAAAHAANPNLKFGQFVAANMIASNLSSQHSNITASAILSGLQSGKSIGQTLHDLGLSKTEAKATERNAKRKTADAQ